jgi:hypothetical protein
MMMEELKKRYGPSNLVSLQYLEKIFALDISTIDETLEQYNKATEKSDAIVSVTKKLRNISKKEDQENKYDVNLRYEYIQNRTEFQAAQLEHNQACNEYTMKLQELLNEVSSHVELICERLTRQRDKLIAEDSKHQQTLTDLRKMDLVKNIGLPIPIQDSHNYAPQWFQNGITGTIIIPDITIGLVTVQFKSDFKEEIEIKQIRQTEAETEEEGDPFIARTTYNMVQSFKFDPNNHLKSLRLLINIYLCYYKYNKQKLLPASFTDPYSTLAQQINHAWVCERTVQQLVTIRQKTAQIEAQRIYQQSLMAEDRAKRIAAKAEQAQQQQAAAGAGQSDNKS